jgi:hypothetical protein
METNGGAEGAGIGGAEDPEELEGLNDRPAIL